MKTITSLLICLNLFFGCSTPKVVMTTKDDIKNYAKWSSPNRSFSGHDTDEVPIKLFFKVDMMFEGDIEWYIDDPELLKLDNLFGNKNVLKIYPGKEKKSKLTIKSDDIEYIIGVDVKLDEFKNWEVYVSELSSEYTKDTYSRKGFYLEMSGVHNSLGNGIKKNIVSTVQDSTVYIPDADNGFGYKLITGLRLPIGSIELGYVFSSHRAEYSLNKTNVNNQQFLLNFKYDFLSETRIQPFIKVGALFNRIDYFNEDEYAKPTKFNEGIGYSAGLGWSYYFTPNISLLSEITYYKFFFDYVTIKESEIKLQRLLVSNCLLINVGVSLLL